MSFLIKDEKLFKSYNDIWKNVSNIIKNDFDCKLIYNEKYLKSYNGNPIMEKPRQIFIAIKYQKKALNVFVYP